MASDNNLAQIIAFLRGKGLTAAQAAGVAGNLKIESGFSPTAYNPREGAIGIAQWELGRRTALQQFAAARGTTETDLSTQLEFLWHELTTSESSSLTALRATSTPQQAAAIFDQDFERSTGSARSQRMTAAGAIYQQETGGTLPAGGTVTGVDVSDDNGSGGALGIIGGLLGGPVAGSQVAGAAGSIMQSVGRLAMIAAFVVAGLGLVVVGIAKTGTAGAKAATSGIA